MHLQKGFFLVSNTYRRGKISRYRFTLQQNIKMELDEIKREDAE
jgi:hypothetical protein